MNLLASLRRLVSPKPLPFPETIEIRFTRTALHLDEDGDTAAVYDVTIDGKPVVTGAVALPPHDPQCPCDHHRSIRDAVVRYFCSRIFRLVPAQFLEAAQRASGDDDEDDNDEPASPAPRSVSPVEQFLFGPPRPKSARRPS